MDSALGLSDVSTVLPSDSASQASRAKSAPSQSRRGGFKRPAQASKDKDAPQGAVKVQNGGQSKTGKSSAVQSATIPLSGWGDLDLHPHRQEVEPTFTIDARPFEDLVDTTYQSIQSRFSSGGKHIPRALFAYYCILLWWQRTLHLHRSNGNVLTTEQKNFLSILSSMEDLNVPSHIAQYLANVGNFLQGGENFYFRMLPHSFGEVDDNVVSKGWFSSQRDDNRVDDNSFWLYSQLPSPAVAAISVCNEVNATLPVPGVKHTLDAISPEIRGCVVYPTDNIVGWRQRDAPPHHSSWRATYANLGWTPTSLPLDTQTDFNLSTTTIKWVSDRLGSLAGFKSHASKQLALSVQGHPMQAYYLSTDAPTGNNDQRPHPQDANTNALCGSRFSDLALSSRFSVDPVVLAPAFSFGYRFRRDLIFRRFAAGVPEFINSSSHQPWLIVRDDAYIALTPAQLVNMNATFMYGAQPYINVPRFATHALNRSSGLDAALILSDTK